MDQRWMKMEPFRGLHWMKEWWRGKNRGIRTIAPEECTASNGLIHAYTKIVKISRKQRNRSFLVSSSDFGWRSYAILISRVFFIRKGNRRKVIQAGFSCWHQETRSTNTFGRMQTKLFIVYSLVWILQTYWNDCK
jgi:hypothetical protein